MPNRILEREFLRNPPLQAALSQLFQARRAADELNLDVWTFAVELSGLIGSGCTPTDLRLLVAGGQIEHAADVTNRSNDVRCFRPEHPMSFGRRTCFVLTEAGIGLLAALNSHSESCHCGGHSVSFGKVAHSPVPLWDPDAREFRAAGQLLKQFRRPAPIMELVLSAFQELKWPPHLDDPLPPEHGIVPEERLRDTVRRLNHCQKPKAVRFASDGRSAGIRWRWSGGKQGAAADEPRMGHGMSR